MKRGSEQLLATQPWIYIDKIALQGYILSMFRNELSAPVQYEAGFFDFFDDKLLPLAKKLRYNSGSTAKLVAHHVIAPGLAPSDKEAFNLVSEHKMAPSRVVGLEYRRRIAAASLLGCATSRLQIAQGSRPSVPLNEKFVRWQQDISTQVHEEAGEGSRVAWWRDQEKAMTEVMADTPGITLLEEFTDGIKQDFPVGGHWTLYGDEFMQEPLLVAGVMYKKDEGEAVFEGFNVYDVNQLTPKTLQYIRFWRDVHLSRQDALVLHETYALS
jgi:hypothetical protein